MRALICEQTNSQAIQAAAVAPQSQPSTRSFARAASAPFRLIQRILIRLRRAWGSRCVKRWVDSEPGELVRLGTKQCSWVLPARTVQAGGTAVCVGAGEDISFDVELNKRGFHVHTLDPTPRSKKHVEKVLEAVQENKPMRINGSRSDYDFSGFDTRRFSYLDVGVWEKDTTMRFYSPQDKDHVSHSIVNLQQTKDYFEARCLTMESLARLLNLNEFTLLKLDIEGAEYSVLRSLVTRGPLPHVLCVEFDEIRIPLDAGYLDRIQESVQMLKNAGYKFAHLDNANALFLMAN
jgi:FkbM family methyltransferase